MLKNKNYKADWKNIQLKEIFSNTEKYEDIHYNIIQESQKAGNNVYVQSQGNSEIVIPTLWNIMQSL